MADLISLSEARVYMGFGPDPQKDAMLAPIIAAVSQQIRDFCARDFDLRAYTEIRNGLGRRAILAQQFPVAAAPAPAATENGVALVVAVGFSTTADVIVDLERGTFYRQPGATSVAGALARSPGVWAPGIQNVVLTYTGGYATIPPDLKLVTEEMVAMYWKHTDRKEWGMASRSDGSHTVSFQLDIPKKYQDILRAKSRPLKPAA